jgi:DNA invertase Pin-like site-specific DNA recombinase
MIQERVRAGLARAKSEGKRLGRPPVCKGLQHLTPWFKSRRGLQSPQTYTSLDSLPRSLYLRVILRYPKQKKAHRAGYPIGANCPSW